MTDFQSAFDTSTNSINSTVTTQLSSVQAWSNVPGTLTKVVSSAAGYLWGYDSTFNVWKCTAPCTGNWVKIDTKPQTYGQVRDIALDDNTVYILIFNQTANTCSLSFGPANGQSALSNISVPIVATNIFSTHTYLWCQDSKSGTKYKLPKPVSMANWLSVSDTEIITSSSPTALYGIMKATGRAVSTNESLTSDWSPISGLYGINNAKIIGDNDPMTEIYVIDPLSKVYKCEGGCSSKEQLQPFDVGSYTPLNITGDPSNSQVWMTTTTNSQQGNIFNKIEKTDYSTILNVVNPLDKKRNDVVDDATKQYTQQSDIMEANSMLTLFKNSLDQFLKQIIPQTTNKAEYQAEIQKLQADTQYKSAQLDQMQFLYPILLKLILSLIVAILTYFIFGFLGSYVNIVVVGVLCVGIYLSLNNGVTLPSSWTKLPSSTSS